MSLPNTTVRIPKAAEIIASVLRRQIVHGELPEGSMLPPETALVARFGVSRPSVREALRVLESEGLVSIKRGAHGGGMVMKPELDLAARYLGRIMQFEGVSIVDVWQARMGIEPAAVRLLTAREGRSGAVQALQGTLDLIDEFQDDGPVYLALSDKFHGQLVQLCGNETLAIMWGCLKEVIHSATVGISTRNDPSGRPARPDKVAAARLRLLELIEAGDPESAQRFWSDEMAGVYRALLRWESGSSMLVEVAD